MTALTSLEVVRLTAACPGRVLVLDGIAVLDESVDRRVVWMSDWCGWGRLVSKKLLRAVYGGPETFGDVQLYLNVPECDLYGCERGHLHVVDDSAEDCR